MYNHISFLVYCVWFTIAHLHLTEELNPGTLPNRGQVLLTVHVTTSRSRCKKNNIILASPKLSHASSYEAFFNIFQNSAEWLKIYLKLIVMIKEST